MIAPDIDKNPPAGVHYIHTENLYTGYHKDYNKKKVEQKVSVNPFVTALKQHIAAEDMCNSKKSKKHPTKLYDGLLKCDLFQKH